MTHGAATQSACDRLPGADLYNKAGALYQSGDHVGAARVVTQAAQAGNALAQLRLAMLYDHSDGVPHSFKDAVNWYRHAAAQGEPAAQEQLGQIYEEGTAEVCGKLGPCLQALLHQCHAGLEGGTVLAGPRL